MQERGKKTTHEPKVEEVAQYFRFTDSDRAPLKALVNFFAPFYKFTKMLESELVATIHNVIPLLCSLERHIRACDDVPAEFRNVSMVALEKRFGFVTHDSFFLSATVLSAHGVKWLANAPNIALKFGDQGYILDKVKQYLDNLMDELPLHLVDVTKDSGSCHSIVEVDDESSVDNIFGYADNTSTSSAHWGAKFDEHLLRTSTLSAVLDPLVYWRAMEISPLSVIAIQILGVPASSAPVKRIFSTCGLI